MSLKVKIKKKLNNFTLDITFNSDDDCIGLLGVSGAGKSMILKCLAGLTIPDSGQIILNDRILFDSDKKINVAPQDRKIAYLFQNYALFPHMSVYENIKFVYTKKDEKCEQEIKELIKLFQLEGLENKYPHHISGGQQQRVALARIIAFKPDVLLLDEPFSSLDIMLKKEMEINLKKYLDKVKHDVIIVTHDYNEVFSLCNKTMVISKGINLCSPTNNEELYSNPKKIKIAKMFGCQNFSKIATKDDKLFASDWNIELNKKIANSKYNYVGIYDSDIVLDNHGCYDFKIDSIIDNVTNYKLTLLLSNNAKPLIFKTNKESIKKNRVNLNNLFLLEE